MGQEKVRLSPKECLKLINTVFSRQFLVDFGTASSLHMRHALWEKQNIRLTKDELAFLKANPALNCLEVNYLVKAYLNNLYQKPENFSDHENKIHHKNLGETAAIHMSIQSDNTEDKEPQQFEEKSAVEFQK